MLQDSTANSELKEEITATSLWSDFKRVHLLPRNDIEIKVNEVYNKPIDLESENCKFGGNLIFTNNFMRHKFGRQNQEEEEDDKEDANNFGFGEDAEVIEDFTDNPEDEFEKVYSHSSASNSSSVKKEIFDNFDKFDQFLKKNEEKMEKAEEGVDKIEIISNNFITPQKNREPCAIIKSPNKFEIGDYEQVEIVKQHDLEKIKLMNQKLDEFLKRKELEEQKKEADKALQLEELAQVSKEAKEDIKEPA